MERNSTALHLKYRPQNLDEFIGNDAIKISLKTLMAREDRPHAYLFTGKTGSGKTTLGRIIANMVGCEFEDLQELNSANTRGIDTVRDITQNAHYAAMVGKVKVYILDEFQSVTGPAMQAILKILEDCPKHVYFILCTTDPDKLLPTIRNRCTTFQVSSLTNIQMKKLLNWVLESEGVKDFSDKVLKEIIRVAEGCPRQALVILDSVIDIIDEKEALEAVSVVTIGEVEVIDICRALIGRQPWKSIKRKVKEVLSKTEPEKLRYAVLGYCSAILLSKDSDDRLSELIDIFSEPTYNTGKAGVVNMCYLATK